MDLSGVDVAILCGGLGTRLRSQIGESQKSMVDVGGRPFLEWLLEYYGRQGFRRFVLCAGYRSELIEKHFGTEDNKRQIVLSKETQPLGTGGAVKNAQQYIQSDIFIVLNGDSFCPFALSGLIDFHIRQKAAGTLAVARMGERGDYGSITLDAQRQIVAFREKDVNSDKQGEGQDIYVNLGVYCFNRDVFQSMPKEDAFSIEYDFFAKQSRGLYGYEVPADFIDLGTPRRLEEARERLKEYWK